MKETLVNAGKAGLFVAGATLVCRAILSAAEWSVEKVKNFNKNKKQEEPASK